MDTLNEAGLQPLYRSSVKAFPKTKKRQHVMHERKVDKLSFVPTRPSGRLLAVARVTGADADEDPYTVQVSLRGVKFADKPMPGYVKLKEGVFGHHYVRPVDVHSGDVRVRCSCGDFRWRFAWYDYLESALRGKPWPKYKAKLRPGSANPKKLPGLCKHLLLVGEELDTRGLLRGKIDTAKPIPEAFANPTSAITQFLTETSYRLVTIDKLYRDNPARRRILAWPLIKQDADAFAESVVRAIAGSGLVELTRIDREPYKDRLRRAWTALNEYVAG